MKRELFPKSLKRGLLAVPAAALMLATSHAAQIGINFQDDWGPLPGDGGAAVTVDAFGIPVANWFNMPRILNSEAGGGVSSNATISLPGGGSLLVEWSCVNTYSLYADVPTSPGEDQVIYGYLDDTGVGYRVRISGFRNSLASYSITLIAATDGGFSFADATVAYGSDMNTLQYLNNYVPSWTGNANPLAGTSTVSSVIFTLNNNNSVVITGNPKSGSDNRSTLAGIIVEYTPGSGNPPVIEVNPLAPAGQVFIGSSFSLSALASGSPTLHYQWRKGGTEIPGANSPSYTNNSAALGDTGDYDVVVTNTLNSVTSTVAHVTVLNVVPPLITKIPLSQTLYQGYPASFSVEATGGQLAYKWKSNSVVILGATNTTYSIPSITTNNAATYTVEVSNPIGPTATASATLAVKVAVPGSYEEAIARTKPALWFRYSDTTAPLQDVAANSGSLATAGNGLYIGANSRPTAGALAGGSDTAASFAGGRVSVPFAANLNPATFTIEAWLKPAVANSGTTLTCPLSSVHIASPRAGWLIYQSVGGWNFRTYNQSGTDTAVNITGGPAPTAGQWYHVVASWDGTVGRVHVNGVLSATSSPTNYIENPDNALSVGARNDGAFVWAGTADEVAHYSTVMSDAQILTHYQNGTNATPSPAYSTLVTTDGAVEYLRLDEGAFGGKPENAGTLGAAWNGTYTDAGGVLGNPQIGVGEAGPRPPTYPGFDSGNRAVSLTNGYTTAPQLTLGNNLTVTCWIKRQAVSTTGDLSWPAWLGGGGMHLANGTATIPAAELRYHWNGGEWAWGSGLFVPAEVWTFCAMVVEPTQATFYMSDGTTLKSAINATAHAAMSVTSPPGFGGNQPGRGDRNYIGQLDETTVYDRSLTPSEINTLFMIGTGSPLVLGLVPGGIIEDSKPVGAPHHGANYLTTWLASSTDAAGTPVTRTGVEQFSTANNSQIAVPADPDFDSATGTFTFWMRATAPVPGPGNEGAMLMDRRTGNGTVIVLNDAGGIFVQCAGGANSLTSAAYVVDDNWHHVAVTYNQANSALIEIYVDGVSSISQANSSAWSWPTTQPVEIGRSHSAYWKRYDGQMDDFRIYNRVLTSGEIASIHASDALVDTSALKLRFNFGTSGIGKSVTWPFGTLLSSPVIGPAASWTPVPGAVVPAYPFMPTEASRFFRATP